MAESVLHLVLRLRGGGDGSYYATFTNILTGKDYSINLGKELLTTIGNFCENVAKELRVMASEITIIVDGKPALATTQIDLSHGALNNKFTFAVKPNYKDVVFTQHATGVWSAKVLELTNTKTLDTLVI